MKKCQINRVTNIHLEILKLTILTNNRTIYNLLIFYSLLSTKKKKERRSSQIKVNVHTNWKSKHRI